MNEINAAQVKRFARDTRTRGVAEAQFSVDGERCLGVQAVGALAIDERRVMTPIARRNVWV
jgi:hypothetical protein